mmetsp:Transcript_1275/g.1527  ORF Transcript_1275/g.1527 Transcript_1275/m.1527 type:complete len:579 (+) Transcript_1275:943-2679(+)
MLQNALGGNSKTYMICAIRPGAKYFDETVNTLRYADRAKQIKNKAVVNENPQDKLIRELKAENERLKKELETAGGPAQVITKEDEDSKKQLSLMQEQLEANQRAMAEMEKSWEDKLKETKEKEAAEEKQREEEEKAKMAGTPHLINLNEDPLLDRKVIYSINDTEPLTCGRRKKGSDHKLQLGGTGIEPEHCKFEHQADGSVKLIPLVTKSMKNIKVNGKCIEDRDGVTLKPNDRVCIGPSAVFLFKHKDKESEASMPDPEDDPISFDFASEEVINVENADQIAAEEDYKRKEQEDSKNALKALEEKLEAETRKKKEEIEKMKEGMEGADAAKKEELVVLEASLVKQNEEKIAKLLAENIRKKNLEAEYNRISKQLNQLLPQVNEANLAASELNRDIKFNTKMVKKIDPNKAGGLSQGKTEILVKVDNNDEKYYYEWPLDKFENRLFMIKEMLEEYFDTGILPVIDKHADPFWDPPSPILIGQSFLQLQPLGCCIENEMTAGILSIDGRGGKQGDLRIGYKPCTETGDTNEDNLPEEFLVESPDQLLGLSNLNFLVEVDSAMNLPSNLCYNPFVKYHF